MECKHSLSVNKKPGSYSYCKTCGIIVKIIKDSLIPISSRSNHSNPDIDNHEIFLNMKAQNLSLNINNIQNTIYTANRKDLIDYIKSYNKKYNYSERSLHLAVFLIDLLSCNEKLFNEYDIELISLSCLILAVKYGENDPNMPYFNSFSNMIKNNFFTVKDLRKMETLCIKKLNYKMDYYTAFHFLEYFLENGIIFSNVDIDIDTMYKNIYEIINYFLKDSKYFKFKPLEIAVSCIAIALEKYNSKEFFDIYRLDEKEYICCIKYLKEILEDTKLSSFITRRKSVIDMKLKYFVNNCLRNKSFNRFSLIDTKNSLHKKMSDIFISNSSKQEINKDSFEVIKKNIISTNTSNISTTNNSVLESGKKENTNKESILQNVPIKFKKTLSKDLDKIKENKSKKISLKF